MKKLFLLFFSPSSCNCEIKLNPCLSIIVFACYWAQGHCCSYHQLRVLLCATGLLVHMKLSVGAIFRFNFFVAINQVG